ncbi:MAG: fumarate hydratase [Lachnospiraceae bacterium]|nr:fumarate hydratase [Lachnospiraceae bacterium]MBR4060048.1 fumarate hydratase [Lachnospiraceae bacterium]
MITQEVLFEAAFQAIVKGATYISDDVYKALKDAWEKEGNPAAKTGLGNTVKSLEMSREKSLPACSDTGWPLFFVKIGNEAELEGGMLHLQETLCRAVEKATAEGYLRKTMKHPLTGFDPGYNVGENVPWITWKFVPGDKVQITYVAKGGGSEVFGGARTQMVAFADGLKGIKKFVVDSFAEATYAGAVCPPSIIGVGIGGTANMAADLAKEAACLRKVGTHHPEKAFAELEQELFEAINSLGIGILGIGGNTSTLGVNVEYAYTHIAGIAVAISCNCMVARRGTYLIHADNSMEYQADPLWFENR